MSFFTHKNEISPKYIVDIPSLDGVRRHLLEKTFLFGQVLSFTHFYKKIVRRGRGAMARLSALFFSNGIFSFRITNLIEHFLNQMKP